MFQNPQSQSWFWSNVQDDIQEKYDKVCMVVRELSEVIKHLEQKIMEIEHHQEESRKVKVPRRCKFFNSGFCKERENCCFEHPESLCQTYLRTSKCQSFRSCPHRHPKVCRYWKNGECFRGQSCSYIHQKFEKEEIAIEEK